jgi:hypothetical protein
MGRAPKAQIVARKVISLPVEKTGMECGILSIAYNIQKLAAK